MDTCDNCKWSWNPTDGKDIGWWYCRRFPKWVNLSWRSDGTDHLCGEFKAKEQ